MNLKELKDKLKFLLHFNTGQTDQAFAGPSTYTDQWFDYAINEAYREECVLGKQNGSRAWFRNQFSFTWPASSTSVTIPAEIRSSDIEAVLDETNASPGNKIQFWDGMSSGSGIYRIDSATWGWSPAPSSAVTLVVVYVGEPTPMSNDADEPSLIPNAHHDLLVWSAAILLRDASDEEAPPAWMVRRDNLRRQLWKTLSTGHPRLSPVATIVNNSPDTLGTY